MKKVLRNSSGRVGLRRQPTPTMKTGPQTATYLQRVNRYYNKQAKGERTSSPSSSQCQDELAKLNPLMSAADRLAKLQEFRHQLFVNHFGQPA
jgi:hypothetical protein